MFYRTFIKNSIYYKLITKLPIGHIMDITKFSNEELDIFYKKIGENIKKFRKEKNLTQMQLALSIEHNSVGHIAKAELYKYGKHFNLEQLYKISKVLDVKLSKLIDIEI